MKQLAAIWVTTLMTACGGAGVMESSGRYGNEFKTDGAITVQEAMKSMTDKTEMNAVVTGTVTEVCKSEGCWLILKNEGGEDLYIDIADKMFHLSSTLEGKKVTVNGKLEKETISVDELKEIAREEGKSAAEISAITTAKDDVSMVANGLVVQP